MFKKIALALSAAAVMAVPAAADAQYYGGYRHHSYRNYGYSYPRTTTVISIGSPGYGYYGGGYGYPAYGYGGGYGGYPAYNYGYGGYPGYYGNYGYNGYGYNSGYGYNGYGYNSGYCGTRTGAGAAIGGVAGALLGSQAAGGHRYSRYGYRHRSGGDRTAGALIGGVLGAAVGGAVASGNCY